MEEIVCESKERQLCVEITKKTTAPGPLSRCSRSSTDVDRSETFGSTYGPIAFRLAIFRKVATFTLQLPVAVREWIISSLLAILEYRRDLTGTSIAQSNSRDVDISLQIHTVISNQLMIAEPRAWHIRLTAEY
ncbi:hypothetical protein DPMN_150084 [Dreissena polymorpha]|uniref:Uncharacterized protein n=1 Tax=Dreissena polymorpha TaxID=45954 RepID=A0A9D4FH97_DREPO|nr:hypothetical protein DPMN_150084 [Dreissena polymorpha]